MTTRRYIGTIRERHLRMSAQGFKAEGIDLALLKDAIGRILPLDIGKYIYAVETRTELGRGQATISTIYQVENNEQRDRRLAMERCI